MGLGSTGLVTGKFASSIFGIAAFGGILQVRLGKGGFPIVLAVEKLRDHLSCVVLNFGGDQGASLKSQIGVCLRRQCRLYVRNNREGFLLGSGSQ